MDGAQRRSLRADVERATDPGRGEYGPALDPQARRQILAAAGAHEFLEIRSLEVLTAVGTLHVSARFVRHDDEANAGSATTGVTDPATTASVAGGEVAARSYV